MRRACVAFVALTLIGVLVASCGRFQREQRAAWRDEAEAACLARGEVRANAYMSLRSTPIQGPGTCGMNTPVRVNAFANGQIGVTATQTLACPIVSTTDRFLAEVVQPAAMGNFGVQVIEMRAGSYSCRAMNNGSGTRRLSEHSFGNALDIFAFRLSDGREITVRGGWNGPQQEQDFLREVFIGACSIYSTVLGPGADMFHYDHLHVDLARHAGGRRICRPAFKFTPRRDLPPPDPAAREVISMAPIRPSNSAALAMTPLPPRHQRQLVAEAAPMTGGPIRLPGSIIGPEEVVVGDVEGDLIDPDKDPFAIEDPQTPKRIAPFQAPPGRVPSAPSASPTARPWPPRF